MTSDRPRWLDFHCHLDLYPDHLALIAECDRDAVATLAVTTTPKAFVRNRELAQASSFVRVGLGLHPQLVAERSGEIALFEHYLPESRYVGEIGLDAGPRFYKSFSEQERIFDRIIRACAEHGGKILSIHSVRSAGKVLDYLDRLFPPDRGKAVLHWFTGSVSEARKACSLGCYFSINIAMLKNDKGRSLVRSLPIDRLLTETDGPFVEQHGRAIRPRDVSGVVRELATLFEVENVVMAQQVLTNLRALTS